MTSESVGLVVHQLAKRFEAAWTREREELDKRISNLEAYAKLWTGRADELRLKCDELYAKAKPVGNAAAMREALLRCEAISCLPEIREQQCVRDMRNIIAATLSAPPRQCDIGTAEEQWKRFDEFCIDWEESGPDGGCSYECPCMAIKSKESDGCFGQSGCFFIWAQMPYEAEEGGAK